MILLKIPCRRFLLLLIGSFGVIALSTIALVKAIAQSHVVTQHNSNDRQGAYLDERVLSPELLRKGDFGRLYSRRVKGFIYAQPLFTEITDGGTKKKAFIVVTTENWVYAFDASSENRGGDEGLLWKKQLPEPAGKPSQFKGCPITTWSIGITSTPVIDDDQKLLYLVARDHRDGQLGTVLHPISVTSREEFGSPVMVSLPMTMATFTRRAAMERPTRKITVTVF